ncbi:MAG: AraC family transcriptional regulator, partial [Lysobacteraceae bacterium]
FADLFRTQIGLPVRKYILWRRLILALEHLKRGDSVTAAAHNAGFSDCAHLSRSFHRAYGTMPSNTELV